MRSPSQIAPQMPTCHLSRKRSWNAKTAVTMTAIMATWSFCGLWGGAVPPSRSSHSARSLLKSELHKYDTTITIFTINTSAHDVVLLLWPLVAGIQRRLQRERATASRHVSESEKIQTGDETACGNRPRRPRQRSRLCYSRALVEQRKAISGESENERRMSRL